MKRIIFGNKNYFIAITIILFTGLNTLNALEEDPKPTEVWEQVPAIVTPGEKGEARFSESSLLQDHGNPLSFTNIRTRELNM